MLLRSDKNLLARVTSYFFNPKLDLNMAHLDKPLVQNLYLDIVEHSVKVSF
jgi:hypothetical protein